MTIDSAKYQTLIRNFLEGAIPVAEFQSAFLRAFKVEDQIDEASFEVLDELFGDVDSYTEDPKLLSDLPDFYLTEQGLRTKAQIAAARLVKH